MRLKCEGHVEEIDALACARVCGGLGGSRFKASDVIDPAVGIVVKRHVGSRVNKGKELHPVSPSTGGTTPGHLPGCLPGWPTRCIEVGLEAQRISSP